MMRNWMSVILLMAMVSACAQSDGVDEAGDQRDDRFLVGGAADSTVPAEGSEDALAVLDLVNTATFDELDVDAELNARSARNIVDHRNGPDDLDGTSDDDPIDSLQELDDIPWVGPAALNALLEYAVGEDSGTTVLSPSYGWVQVTTPEETMPHWVSHNTSWNAAPAEFDPAFYWVFEEDGYTPVTRVLIGEKAELDAGTYTVWVNGTGTTVDVAEDAGLELETARIEVADVDGTYRVKRYTALGYASILSRPEDIDTGRGIDVLPGKYQVPVSYQHSTRTFDVELDAGEVRVIQPDPLSATVTIEVPDTTVPDYDFPSRRFRSYRGPYDDRNRAKVHAYDSQQVHVYRQPWNIDYANPEFVGTYPIDRPISLDPGTYRLVVNNTFTEIELESLGQEQVHLGRMEFTGFGSEAEILVKTAWPTAPFSNSNYENVFDNEYLPSDVGVNVFPGDFFVRVFRNGSNQNYDLTVE